jgi:putative MATE family efflux protein
MNTPFIKEYLNTLIPIFSALFVVFILNITDSFFISTLGQEAIAGYGLAMSLMLFVVSTMSSVSQAVSVFVSKSNGAKKINRQKVKIFIGLFINIFLSLFLIIIFYILEDKIYGLFKAQKEVLNYTKDYFSIWYMGLIFVSLNIYFQNIINAIGKSKITAYVLTLTVFLNIILDYILIYGLDGYFTAFGISGAALASVISMSVGAIIYLYYLFKKGYLKYYNIKSSHSIILKMKNLILHFLVPGWTYPLSMIVVSIAISKYNTDVLAAYALVDSFKYILLIISSATATTISLLVSKFLGAKKIEEIRHTYHLSLIIMFSWSLITFLIINSYSDIIGGYYLNNKNTINIFSYIWSVFILGAIAWAYAANTGRLMLSYDKGKYASIYLFIGNVSTIIIPYIVSIFYGYKLFIWSIVLIGFFTALMAFYFYVTKIKQSLQS